MTLQQLAYFKAIARKKSFAQASQELYVTQPSLSFAMQSLERELDVPLLVREKGKKIKLTTYGQALLPYAEKALSILDDGTLEIKRLKNPSSGIVKITLSYAASFSYTLRMLNSFVENSGSKDISLQFQVNQAGFQFLNQLPMGIIDLAFSGVNEGQDIASVPLVKDDVVVLLPRNHHLAEHSNLTLHQVRNEPLIFYSQHSKFYMWLEKLFASNNITPKIHCVASNWSTLVANVALSTGIAITPSLPIDEKLLIAVPFIYASDSSWSTYMLWPTNRELSAAALEVKNFCLAYSEQNKG